MGKRPRDPHANNAIATARVSDVTKAELRGLADKSDLTLLEITRKVIMAGLPIVKREISKQSE